MNHTQTPDSIMKNISRSVVTALSFASLALPAPAETITSAQREKLSKALDLLINKSKATLNSRQATAYKAYKEARGSNSAAYDLYLDCVEKVDFLDSGKKSSDFRDWKKVNKGRISDPAFRLALRHQLNWLVLTIEAARQEEADYATLTPKARSAISSIFEDAKRLEGYHSILRQDVLSSVFAKAYGFGSYKVKEWPTNPLNLVQVYDKVIFPPLRNSKKAATLRSAWMERISYQEQSLENWAPMPKSKTVGMKKDLKPPAYNKFLETEKPKLIWEMEMDVYKAGDEYGAATRMLTHLSRNISHNSAPEWAKTLTELIGPPADKKEAPLADSSEPEPRATPQPTPTPPKKSKGNYIELQVN